MLTFTVLTHYGENVSYGQGHHFGTRKPLLLKTVEDISCSFPSLKNKLQP